MRQWFLIIANGQRVGRLFATKSEIRSAMPRARLCFDRDCVTLLSRP